MAGNIKIIEPKENFQKVSKDIIFSDEVDVLTLGVYVKILCLGKKWNLNVDGLAELLSISDVKVKACLSKLERAGYLKRVRTQGEGGRFAGVDYHISAVPFPESERTDMVQLHRKKDSTINHKIQPMENPTDGEPNRWENHPMENPTDINRDNSQDRDSTINRDSKEKKTPTPSKFDFRKAMTDQGVEPPVADAWLEVRRQKKAVNTEISWNYILNEIKKSGLTANECIRTAVVENWRGFKAAWLQNLSDKGQGSKPILRNNSVQW